MTERISLKQLERKAYLSYHQDGVVDLLVGTFLLTMSAFMVLAGFLSEDGLLFPAWSVSSLPALMVCWIISYAGVKKAVTVPRFGYVEFSARQRGRVRAIWLGFIMINVVLLVLGCLLMFDRSLRDVLVPILVSSFLLVIGLVGGGIFLVLAFASGIRRFYGYGAVTLGAFVLSQVFSVPMFWPTMVLAVVTTVTGAVLLVRFVGKYPRVKAGEMGDAGPREE